MRVLAIDCSVSGCAAAVTADGRLAARADAAPGAGQAEALMPLLARTMRDAGIGWDGLGLIAVTVGPGSFTGLRIGLAAARGLALASGVPLAGIPTPDAIAEATGAEERAGRCLMVAIDARRSDLFVRLYASDLTPLGPIEAMLAEDAARRLPGPLLLAGNGAARIAALRPEVRISAAAALPDPVLLASLAERRFRDGSALPPVPLYLRPADVTLPKATG